MARASLLELSGCTIDLDREVVHARDGGSVGLTTREAALLRYLSARPSQPVDRDELLSEVWGVGDHVLTRAADTAVRRLRSKIEIDPARPRHLLTVHGVGYRFEPGTAPSPSPPPRAPRSLIELGDTRVDPAGLTVRRGRKEVALTAQEGALLAYLAGRPGAVVGRDELLRHVWEGAASPKAVDHAIRRLRRKVEDDPARPRWLRTVRGRGYRLDIPAERAIATDALVGRDAELDQLAALLAGGGGPITVTGPGGMGKTRLARALLAERQEGSTFCDLTSARSGSQAALALANAFDLTVGPHRDAVSLVCAALGRRAPGLIVLDNAEHIAAAIADLVERLRAEAPDFALLVTSRVALGISDEIVVDLGPLPLSDGVRLFRTRAAAAGTPVEAPAAIEALVERLEGMPLAIELAAARIGVLSPEDLLRRLSRQLDLLRRPGALPARHATLRHLIGWSWDLLRPWEAAAMERLALFRGGFTADAAEAVLDHLPWPEAPDVLDVLQSLRDQSLLWTLDEGRLGMYETIRAFADERRRERGGDAGTATLAHVRWAARLGDDRVLDSLRRCDEGGAWEAAMAEHDNLLVALERALVLGRASDCARIARVLLAVIGRGQGAYVDGLAVSREVLDLDGHTDADRARLLVARANLFRATARWSEAYPELEEALALAESSGDGPVRMDALFWRGVMHADTHERARARACWERSAELADRNGRRAFGAYLRGKIERTYPEHTGAAARFEEAVRLARLENDRALEARCEDFLARAAWQDGRLAESRDRAERAQSLYRATRDGFGESILITMYSLILMESGGDDVPDLLEAFLGVVAAYAHFGEEGLVMTYLGCVHGWRGRHAEAHRWFSQARQRLEAQPDPKMRAYFEWRVGEHFMATGALVSAGHSLQIARRRFREVGLDVHAGSVDSALAELSTRAGRLAEARARVDAAERALRRPGVKPGDLAVLLCRKGVLEVTRGSREAASACLAEAEGLLLPHGGGRPGTEAGVALERLRRALAPPPGQS